MKMLSAQWVWNVVGVLLLCLVGMCNRCHCMIVMGLYLAGWGFVIIPLFRGGMFKPNKMCVLLLSSNVGFWGAFILAQIRGSGSLNPMQSGIQLSDIAGGLWLLTFALLSIVEGVVFVRGIISASRRICVLGLFLVVVQVVTSMNIILEWIESS